MPINVPESRTRVELRCHLAVAEHGANSDQQEDGPLHTSPTSLPVPRAPTVLVRFVRRALQRFKSFYPVITRTIGSIADVLSCMGI
jgi:hypothetical protein